MPTINVLITREQDGWVAVGLEHFAAGQGETPLQAIRDLEVQFEGQEVLDRSVGQEPFALVLPAPDRYWKLFAAAPLRLVWQGPSTSPIEGELRMSE